MKKIPENVRAALLFAGAVAVLIFLVKIIPTFQKNTITNNTELPSGIRTVTILEQAQKDTDGDGVADWEERLWGTDPLLADTDNDGISDGEFIEQERQRLRANNQDAVSANISDDSVTVRLGQELLVALASLEDGQYISSAQMKRFVEGIDQRITTPVPAFTVTQEKQKNNTPAAFDQYYNAFVAAINLYPDEADQVLAMLERSYASDETIDFVSLAEQVTSVGDALSYLDVPQRFVKLHTSLVRGYWGIGISVEQMAQLESDPLRVLPALQTYIESYDQVVQDLNNVNMYFIQSGILSE